MFIFLVPESRLNWIFLLLFWIFAKFSFYTQQIHIFCLLQLASCLQEKIVVSCIVCAAWKTLKISMSFKLESHHSITHHLHGTRTIFWKMVTHLSFFGRFFFLSFFYSWLPCYFAWKKRQESDTLIYTYL